MLVVTDVLGSWSSIAATALVLLLLVVAYIWYSLSYVPYQHFKRVGIPGPKPVIFDGNCKQMQSLGTCKRQKVLAEEYGPVVGYYIGVEPWLQISDMDMLKEISINHFGASFTNRTPPRKLLDDGRISIGLLRARDEHWRTARRTLTPTFSAHKMKMMEPLIAQSSERLAGKLEEVATSGKSIDVFKLFGRYTMEVILTNAFGRYVDIQNADSDDELTKSAASLFSETKEDSNFSMLVLAKWTSMFPWLIHLIRLISGNSPLFKARKYLVDVAEKLVKKRREEGDNRQFKDLLQLMLEAHREQPSEGETKGLTDKEIVAHSVTFLLAGYETTSTALAYMAYLLAVNPEVQDKLDAEINAYFEENPDSSFYDASQNINYLDMVMNESLRMYPPAPRTSRECSKEVVVKGVTIPKGTVIAFPIYYLHHNPELWQDPEKFDPERFSPENKAGRHPCSFMPFGIGPRNCIGMRFAILEAKMALIEIMRKFRFSRSPDTEVPLQTSVGITMSPKNGVFLKIEKKQR